MAATFSDGKAGDTKGYAAHDATGRLSPFVFTRCARAPALQRRRTRLHACPPQPFMCPKSGGHTRRLAPWWLHNAPLREARFPRALCCQWHCNWRSASGSFRLAHGACAEAASRGCNTASAAPSLAHLRAFTAVLCFLPLTYHASSLRCAVGETDVAFDIKFCGICHSDVHTVRSEVRWPVPPGGAAEGYTHPRTLRDCRTVGCAHSSFLLLADAHVCIQWGPCTYPCVPGHELVGVVTKVGSKVSKFKAGDLVGVGCMVGSCKACNHCKCVAALVGNRGDAISISHHHISSRGLEQYCEKGCTFTCAFPLRKSG